MGEPGSRSGDLNSLMEQLLMEKLYGAPPSARAGGIPGQGLADSDEEFSCYYDNNGEYEEDEEQWDSSSKECDAQAEEDSVPGTFWKSFLGKEPSPAPPPHSSLGSKLLDLKLPQRQQLTAEEAERNAKELVAEEERVKKKAEKKRLKKKRQKDRKRQEKLGQELKLKPEMRSNEPCLNGETQQEEGVEGARTSSGKGLLDPSPSQRDPGEDPAPRRVEGARAQGRNADVNAEEEMEDELDLSSTFVSKAQRKVGVKPLPPRKEKVPRAEDKEPVRRPQQEAGPALPSPTGPACRQRAADAPEPFSGGQVARPGQDVSGVDPSAVLAGYGNEAAVRGCFQEAVLFFTEAVKLNPREHRLFGNRSYCHERMAQYGKALSDAHMALSLLPGWPKGLFRKGKALLGLKRYAEARSTFLELLQRDSSHADAAGQLEICQLQLMLENGFGSVASGSRVPAGRSPGTPEPRPAGSGEQARSCAPGSGGRGEGDEDGEPGFVTITHSRSRGKGSAQQKPRASSRETLASSSHPAATPHQARFGPIHSVRLLPEKFCAFINYTRKEAAEAAYAALQGAEVEGTKFVLQLKHPDHATPPPGRAAPSNAPCPVVREPVCLPHTLECHFWRNTGCSYGAGCRFRHLPHSKGLDKKLTSQ